jgi:signal transduction histidine kinase
MTVEINLKDRLILIVDDNTTNLRVINDYLKELGFRTLMARNGESCIKRAQYGRPDIILLDVLMPGIDGFETCRLLKKNEITRDIPVIFLTALASEDEKVKGFDVGAVDYITKPIQQREVLARLSTHLKIQTQARELQAKNKALTELNLSKDKFFSIVAHDLKGPFMPLLGNAELIAEMADTMEPAEIKKIGEGIHHSAQRVFDLLENLLQWASMQMGRMEYKPTSINLQQIVQQSIEPWIDSSNSKKIILENRVVDNLFVYADKNMLSMVIRNLINNALKFTPNGGRIAIDANDLGVINQGKNPKLIKISVSDTGVGINQEDIDKLFKIEVHHSTTGTANETGTGLGLIMCKEMVEMNGGKIWVESKLGSGTVVKFTIPS